MDTATLAKLQIATVVKQAIEQPGGPASYLQENLTHHNIAEFCSRHSEHGEVWLAFTDGSTKLAAACKTKLDLPPSVFVLFSNKATNNTASWTTSTARFYCGLSPLNLELSPGAQVHGQSAQTLEQATLIQTLLNLLGQGYEVTLCGQDWGGVAAHVLALKLLLQLRQEIELAKTMGINLSGLQQTEGKVTSFAFGSPLVGDQALVKALEEHSLAGCLHTIWKKGDACPHFCTLTSELAMQAEGPDVGTHPDAIPGLATGKAPFSFRSKQFAAVQAWASAAHQGVQALPRHKQVAPCALPLDTKAMQSSVDNAAAALHTGGTQGSGEGSAGGYDSGTDHDRSSASSATGAGAPKRTSQGGHPPTSRLAKDPQGSQPLHTQRPSPKSRAALNALRTVVAVAAAGRSPVQKATPPNLPTSPASKLAASKAAVPTAAAAPKPPIAPPTVSDSSDGAWKQPLAALLACADSLSEPKYVPGGRFWVLERMAKPVDVDVHPSGPAPKAAKGGAAGAAAAGSASAYQAEALAQLTELPMHKVVPTGQTWLSEVNPDLLASWAPGMEEMQADLMEVFPWLTFSPTVTGADGKAMDRRARIRVTRAIDMY